MNSINSSKDANSITVGFLLGDKREVAVEKGQTYTVAQLLAKSELKVEGHQIRVDGEPANLNTVVTAGQDVLLLKPVQGN